MIYMYLQTSNFRLKVTLAILTCLLSRSLLGENKNSKKIYHGNIDKNLILNLVFLGKETRQRNVGRHRGDISIIFS